MKNSAAIPGLLLFLCIYSNVCGQSVSGVLNTYYQVTAVNTTSNTVTVSNSSGLSIGQRVLILQAKGATISTPNSATYGDISALNNAGGYEFNTICSINGNDVWLKDHFVNTYNAAGLVQLVTMPSYSSVVIGGAVTAAPWDPVTGTGGVVVLEATGTITLNADIDVSGQGFQGGALVNYPTPTYNCTGADVISDYFLPLPASGDITGGKKGEGIAGYVLNEEYARGKLANGGGGGNNANAGGGGGGNYGAGGIGGKRAGESLFNCHGQYPGVGGIGLAAYGYSAGINRIFFGGGGGSGHEDSAKGTPGGNGGGMIILSAATIVGGGGRLIADGLTPVNMTTSDPAHEAEGDGGGGGGAGGVIILNAATVTGAVTAEAVGGRGSNTSYNANNCTGPGGGGGGGLVWTAGAGVPAAVTATVNGGANGLVSLTSGWTCRGSANGATSGAAGTSKAGYTPPVSAGPACTVLASPELKYFIGDPSGVGVLLHWAFVLPASVTDIRSFAVQRSTDHFHFTEIAVLPASRDSIFYRYIDAAENIGGDIYYRLVWQHGQGALSYSRIIAVNRGQAPAVSSFRLQPNPVTDDPMLVVAAEREGNARATVYNAQGQVLLTVGLALHKGVNSFPLSLRALAPAGYFLAIDMEGRRQVKTFIKRG